MNKQKQLQTAIFIASVSHMDQFDRAGKPYILHPLHLMSQLLFDTQLATIAVLHDAIEDSTLTIDDLIEEGFSSRVIIALRKLTHIKGVSYEDYIEDISTCYDAIIVKRKDLEHNSDITRLKGVTSKDLLRVEKYHKAFVKLTEAKRLYTK